MRLESGLFLLTDNSGTINRIRELIRHDNQSIHDFLRLIFGILPRDWNGGKEKPGENGPEPGSLEIDILNFII